MEQETLFPKIKGPIEILKENGMWPVDPASPKGKSIDNPVLIEGVRLYVDMEYRVMNFMYADKQHELIIQGLCEKDGRKIDVLLMKISNADGSSEHTEKIFFDITEGFNSL